MTHRHAHIGTVHIIRLLTTIGIKIEKYPKRKNMNKPTDSIEQRA